MRPGPAYRGQQASRLSTTRRSRAAACKSRNFLPLRLTLALGYHLKPRAGEQKLAKLSCRCTCASSVARASRRETRKRAKVAVVAVAVAPTKQKNRILSGQTRKRPTKPRKANRLLMTTNLGLPRAGIIIINSAPRSVGCRLGHHHYAADSRLLQSLQLLQLPQAS